MIFKDRAEAGSLLAERFLRGVDVKGLNRPIVVGLPRGGVPVAAVLAERLNVPFDVLVVRKIGAPENPEFGIGAITESGYFWINPENADLVRMDAEEMERAITRELERVKARSDLYRGGRELPDLKGRTVIVVDDGIATGVTAVVACRYLRSQGASQIILAAPVCAEDTLPLLNSAADQVVYVQAPKDFSAVGLWYDDFSQTTDEDVVRILRDQRADLKPLGDLVLPPLELGETPKGVVIFAHGSGSSRFSPRNRAVAARLNQAGFATLLFDLLTEEEAADRTRVFDIPFLAQRLVSATGWVNRALGQQGFSGLRIGYFGASTGAAAALWAAADLGNQIGAVVSRGGRPDLAASRLTEVKAPTLLIVGSLDHPVIEMNERALKRLRNAEMILIEGATHLFEEPGTLDEVAEKAIEWFEGHLATKHKKVA